jgi:predicted N-formylglutamate amidohydrolase
MGRIEILVEEASMEECLRNLLPKIVPNHWKLDENYFIRKHQGKSDLKKSIKSKIPVFNHWHESISVIILHDQDSSECKSLKEEIKQLCNHFNKPLLIIINVIYNCVI